MSPRPHAPEFLPVVETTNGSLRGRSDGRAQVLKGIRYAAAPVGPGRFAAPMPANPWAGVLDADEWPLSAPQEKIVKTPPFRWYWSDQPCGEDCLALNVFTPAVNDGGRRPVMVWLHGGGMASGSGTAPGFHGSVLAATGDVVVVTVNHRLNIFGFFSPGPAAGDRFVDAPNAGLLDIVAALEWVRDNISAFGGDPGNVTLFGQSGGAGKIGRVMAMPKAKGLFHRAVLQSSALRAVEPGDAERAAGHVLDFLGLGPSEAGRLADVPADALLEARAAAIRALKVDCFQPVIDGRNLFEAPFQHTAPEASRDVPLLIGTTADEAMYRLYGQADIESLSRQEVLARLERYSGIRGADVLDIYDSYAGTRIDASPLAIYCDIMTDQRFRLNTLRTAELKAAQGGAPAFLYRFQWRSPLESGRIRSPHTIEIPFIFGTTDAAAAMVGDGSELARLQSIMMAAWVAFARTGNPNHTGLPDWQPYSADKRGTMLIDLPPRFGDDPPGADIRALERFRLYRAHSTDM